LKRFLRSTTRTTASENGYRAAWDRVAERMKVLGGRAWAFRSVADPNRHIEFIEWKQSEDAADLLADAELNAALARLDDYGRGTIDTWVEH
jgi:hypothetical protein